MWGRWPTPISNTGHPDHDPEMTSIEDSSASLPGRERGVRDPEHVGDARQEGAAPLATGNPASGWGAAGASEYAHVAAFSLDHADRPGIVIALHGLTGTRAQPLGYLSGFESPEFGVLAPDLRAHGDTAFIGNTSDFTPSQLAADVTALVRQLGLGSKRVCVVGVSLGATVALELLRCGSLDIAAVVFIRPTHTAAPASHLQVNALIASYLLEDPNSALSRLLASDPYRRVATVSDSAASSLRDKVTKPRSAERAMRLAMGAYWTAFVPGEMVKSAVPSLVVAAQNDPLHPIAVAEEWHTRIENSTLTTLPSRDDDPVSHAALTRSAVQGFILDLTSSVVRPQ
jgi:pimeloyl-ACP methyl ester carboxylesterase